MLVQRRESWSNEDVPSSIRQRPGRQGQYRVDSDLVRAGEINSVAIRVFQNDPRPNFSVAPPVLLNETSKQAIRMAGKWQYRPGDRLTWSQAAPADFAIVSWTVGDNDQAQGVFAKIDNVPDIQRYVRGEKYIGTVIKIPISRPTVRLHLVACLSVFGLLCEHFL